MISRNARRVFFWSLVLLYGVAAALLLLFGNGYRMQMPGFRLTRTGNLLVTFVPGSARVTLDDALVETSAPARVRAVFPGVHTIGITADGYFPYNEQIRVEPMQTTFVSDVYLLERHAAALAATSSTAPAAAVDAAVTLQNPLAVSSTPAGGTIITNGGKALTRDLGIGAWHIAGDDARYFILSHAQGDASEMQFRTWSAPDTIAFSIPGVKLLTQDWNNVSAVSVHLVYSPFELWEVNPAAGTATILSRLSKPIRTVLPVPGTAVALVVLPDEIVAYQLADTMNSPVSVVQAPGGSEIVDASLDAAGGVLTYTTKSGAVFSTWKQTILSR